MVYNMYIKLFTCFFLCFIFNSIIYAKPAPCLNTLNQIQLNQMKENNQVPLQSNNSDSINKIENMVNYLGKLENGSTTDMFDILFTIKKEVEKKVGQTLRLNTVIDNLEAELRKNDVKIPYVFYEIKRHILEWNNFTRQRVIEKKELPPKMVWGVTIVCAGGLLCCVPILQAAGGSLVGVGTTLCLQAIIEKQEEEYKNKYNR